MRVAAGPSPICIDRLVRPLAVYARRELTTLSVYLSNILSAVRLGVVRVVWRTLCSFHFDYNFVTKSEPNHSFQPGYMHSNTGSLAAGAPVAAAAGLGGGPRGTPHVRTGGGCLPGLPLRISVCSIDLQPSPGPDRCSECSLRVGRPALRCCRVLLSRRAAAAAPPGHRCPWLRRPQRRTDSS
eukprot:COSAG02_NODE_71_length_42019_cov_36.443893_25_plen_183_part_00